jgi:hypothetical protein
VNRLGVKDAREEILAAQRVEATGLQVHWPTRLAVEQLLVSGPRAIIERDKAGAFPRYSLEPPATRRDEAGGVEAVRHRRRRRRAHSKSGPSLSETGR